MSASNSILRAINAYLDRSNTQYAIMIDGAWGVGKTHFVLNSLIPERAATNFVYASLYGLSTFDEIDLEIDAQLEANSSAGDRSFVTGETDSGSTFENETEGTECVLKDSRPISVSSGRNTKCPVVVCLDDLERWNGDLDLCLSYVNRLVEHKNVKCILIGNIDELRSESIFPFSSAREKTIRHIYHFDNDFQKIIEVSLDLVDYGSKASRFFLRSIVKENLSALDRLLDEVSVKNIRIITEAFQLYEYVYRHNSGKFKFSRNLAFTYLMSLISVIILVTRYLVDKKDREGLLNRNHNITKGFKFLSDIGYFEDRQSGVVNPKSKLLLDTVFYRLDQISLNGLFSIVSNGYYVKEDFVGEFDCWLSEQNYDLYLDKDRYYQLDDDDARQVFDVMLSSLIDDRSVTNPVTLLLLAERMISDIACGVVDYNPVNFKKQFTEAVNALYDSGRMQNMEINIFDIDGNRFNNLRGLYSHVLKRNNEYQVVFQKAKLSGFWKQLSDSPTSIDAQLKEFHPRSVFSQAVEAEDIIAALELLNNKSLCQVVEWIEAGLDKSSDKDMSLIDSGTVNSVNQAIRTRYGKKTGVRANHLRQIAEIITRSIQTNRLISDSAPAETQQEIYDFGNTNT